MKRAVVVVLVVFLVVVVALGAGAAFVERGEGGADEGEGTSLSSATSVAEQRAGERRSRRAKRMAATAPTAADPVERVEDAVLRLRLAYVACVVAPERCVTDTVVAVGTPAAAWLDDHVGELRRWNIGRAVDVPGDRISIVRLTPAATDRVVAQVCIVDDLPLVDRGATDDPLDDIPYVNPPLSVMVRWELVITVTGWRIADRTELGHFPESDTCEPPHA